MTRRLLSWMDRIWKVGAVEILDTGWLDFGWWKLTVQWAFTWEAHVWLGVSTRISGVQNQLWDMLETSTARIYTEDIPRHPGDAWTRFVCISDTHSRKFRVPPGDVLLHAGDLSSWGEFHQLDMTIQWLKSLDHPTKMYTNHNYVCQTVLFWLLSCLSEL